MTPIKEEMFSDWLNAHGIPTIPFLHTGIAGIDVWAAIIEILVIALIITWLFVWIHGKFVDSMEK